MTDPTRDPCLEWLIARGLGPTFDRNLTLYEHSCHLPTLSAEFAVEGFVRSFGYYIQSGG